MHSSPSDAIAIWQAGVASVVAESLVSRSIRVTDDRLDCNDWSIDLQTIGDITVVGGGKATAAMATGLERSLGQVVGADRRLSGWINIPEGTEQPLRWIHAHIARPAGVNEPTESAAMGTQQILKAVKSLQQDDLCIALISGGGSALLPAPRTGISLEEKLAVTQWLSGAGANIQQLNTVRKHLSDIKGGRLLASCKAGHLLTLVISDVLGDPLDGIASGPTVPDTSTAAEAIEILKQFDPDRELPSSIYRILNSPRHDEKRPATCQHHIEVIGNNALAVDEAGICAERLGYSHAMQSATRCEGAAEDIGRHLAKMSLQMLRKPRP